MLQVCHNLMSWPIRVEYLAYFLFATENNIAVNICVHKTLSMFLIPREGTIGSKSRNIFKVISTVGTESSFF